MTGRLQDRAAVVTGGAAGLGFASSDSAFATGQTLVVNGGSALV